MSRHTCRNGELGGSCQAASRRGKAGGAGGGEETVESKPRLAIGQSDAVNDGWGCSVRSVCQSPSHFHDLVMFARERVGRGRYHTPPGTAEHLPGREALTLAVGCSQSPAAFSW